MLEGLQESIDQKMTLKISDNKEKGFHEINTRGGMFKLDPRVMQFQIRRTTN